jgi:hypothetical protein
VYRTLDDFERDVNLMFDNCRSFNPEGTAYYDAADELQRAFRLMRARVVDPPDTGFT